MLSWLPAILFIGAGCGASNEARKRCTGRISLDDGYIACLNGPTLRDVPLALATAGYAPLCDGQQGSCATNTDCSGLPYGECTYLQGADDPLTCACTASCVTDADCAPDEACVPGDLLPTRHGRPQCIPATCWASSDCPSGLCALSHWPDPGCREPLVSLACMSSADTCTTHEDCTNGGCGVPPDGVAFTCSGPPCVVD